MQQIYGRFISILIIVMGLSLQAQAAQPKPEVTAAPAWIKALPHRITTTIDPKEVNDGYHFLQRVLQWNVATGDTYFHNTYKITTDEGVQNSSEIKFSYEPSFEKLQLHKVIVWRNGKPINKLDITKVKVL